MKTKHKTITKTNHKPYKKYDLKADRYKYYKGRYIICFYDEEGEFLVHMFDSIKDILNYQHKEITQKNKVYANTLLYNALKSETHLTTMLDNRRMQVYIVDLLEE